MVFFAYKNWGEFVADVIFMTIAVKNESRKEVSDWKLRKSLIIILFAQVMT